MNYSKFGIGMMILFSLIGLYVAFMGGIYPMILGLTIFLLCTFVWVESVYSEFKYRKKESELKKRKIKIKKELRKFLIMKGVLNEFETNVRLHTDVFYKCYDGISSSFIWSETKEGNDFWYEIHKEFEKTKVKEEN